MQSYTFSRDELFTDFDEDSSTTYTLENDHVEIVINIDLDGNLILVKFYKKEQELRKGIVRCALLLLLEKILKDSEVTPQHTISVMKPTPSDGNLERLIKMYKEMGFILEKEDPPELKNTIQNIIDTLKTQCNFIAGKRTKKYKRKSRRSYKI
jgi:hypothetical protein